MKKELKQLLIATSIALITVQCSTDSPTPETLTTVSAFQVNLTEAGKLDSKLKNLDPDSLKSLTISGFADARDFKTIRNKFPSIQELDLTNLTIVEYTGKDGTYLNSNIYYPANTIPDYCFYNLESFKSDTLLQSIKLPTTITEFGTSAFDGCSALNAIEFPPYLRTINNYAFRECTNLKIELVFPNSVQYIGTQAFYNCKSIYGTISIPEYATFIGDFAFADCSMIDTIYAYPKKPINLGTNPYTFRGISTKNTPLFVTDTVVVAYKSADGWKNFEKILAFPTNVQ